MSFGKDHAEAYYLPNNKITTQYNYTLYTLILCILPNITIKFAEAEFNKLV